MSRNIKILFVLVVATAFAYWLVSRQPWNTFKGKLKDFAIKDTSEITRIFFADKRNNTVLLQRNEKHEWMVNNKFIADADKVNLLLATIHDVEVRNPILETENNTVIGILATNAIKTEFYRGNKLIKTIYVGSATPDQTGTYMLIDGSSEPYVTHVSGFVGYLSSRFCAEEKKWKSREIFNVKPELIKSVSVQYPEDMSHSFIIENGTTPVLKSNDKILNSDPKYLLYYLNSFQHLYFEGYSDATNVEIDSVQKITPFCVIVLTKNDGSKIKLQVNRKGVDRKTKEHYDTDSHPMEYDSDRYLAFLNEEKDMLVLQQYSFGKIFKTLDDILISK